MPALAQVTDFHEHALLAGSGWTCSPSWLRQNPNRIFPTRCPLGRLRSIASRVRSPIASRSYRLTAAMIVMTRRPAAEVVSNDFATEISATPALLEESQHAVEVLDGAREPFELGDDYGIHSAAVH